jgi:prevent-host-death family protein
MPRAKRAPGRGRAIVNIAEAKAHLPELVERAARGEEIIVARAGKPRARLVPLEDDKLALRVPGKGKARFEMAADFDAPLPPEWLDLFEGRTR